MSQPALPDAPPFFTGRIAGWSRAHRRLVLAAWVLIALFTIGACVAIGPDEDLDESGTGESGEAADLFDDRFSEDRVTTSETIIFDHPTLTVDDPVYRQTVTDLLAELRSLRALNTETVGGTEVASSTRVFAATTSHYDIGAPREESPLVSPGAGAQGGDVTFADAEYATNDPDDVSEELDTIRAAVAAAAEASGFEILIGGGFILDDDFEMLIEEDFGFASLVNLPLTLIILLIALGAVAAAALPIGIAYLGVAMAAGVVTLISLVTPMLDVWIQIVLLMGLAAGIDYSLFLFTRYRFERDNGRDPDEAAAIASNTAGKGVLIAALTTMLAILGMFLVGDPVFTSLGIAAVVTIFVALLVALTLMPALLSDNLSRWRLPWLRNHNVAISGSLNRPAGIIVGRCAGPRGWIYALIGVAAMLALAYPILDFNLGFNGVTAIHDDIESKAAIEKLEEDFTLGVLADFIKLAENRTATVIRNQRDANLLLVSVAGRSYETVSNTPGPSTVEVSLERLRPGFDPAVAGDLAWEASPGRPGRVVLEPAQRIPGSTIWSGSISIPNEAGPHRLLIREFEVFSTGAALFFVPPTRRLVYADAIEV